MAAITQVLRDRTELANRAAAGSLTIFDPPGPGDRTGLSGDDGDLLDLLWVQDSTTPADLEVVIFTGGDPVQFDEVLRLDVIIQTIRRGASATMADADQAAEEIYGEVLGALASAPQIVDGTPDDPTVNGIEALVTGLRSSAGWLPDLSGFGTRLEVEVETESRFLLS
jgi:hypothetical protein